MKILIVGLPLFAKRFHQEISEYDPSNQYYVLDTYYSKWDKLKALFLIPRVDVIFSINGTLQTSKVIDLAFKKNKKVIFNWVGTDVQLATEAVKNNTFIDQFKSQAVHLCEVDWIKEELGEIGVIAEVQNFAVFEKHFKKVDFSSTQMNVLTYIANGRPEFYGIQILNKLAKEFPDVTFNVAGLENYEGLEKNINLLGWVEDMSIYFDQAQICLRYAEHDGLSNFILEALARGKHVLYNQPFNHCNFTSSFNELKENMKKLQDDFKNGNLEYNIEGANFVNENFNRKAIFEPLIERFKA